MCSADSRKQDKGPWNDWYHCMGHTYGTWLPGDPRGFRTRHHREHIEGDYRHPPPKGKYAARYEHAKNLMKRDPVYLTIEQRLLVVRLLVESLQRKNFDVPTACVTDVHFHLLARFPDHNPRHWIGIAKKESSHFAKQHDLGAEGGLWAVRTKSLPLNDRSHQLNAAKYIFDHRVQGGAVWYRSAWLLPATHRRWRHGLLIHCPQYSETAP
jgi:REP element-mobilizing transposase RayT